MQSSVWGAGAIGLAEAVNGRRRSAAHLSKDIGSPKIILLQEGVGQNRQHGLRVASDAPVSARSFDLKHIIGALEKLAEHGDAAWASAPMFPRASRDISANEPLRGAVSIVSWMSCACAISAGTALRASGPDRIKAAVADSKRQLFVEVSASR